MLGSELSKEVILEHDRFHVVKHLNDAVDLVRKQERAGVRFVAVPAFYTSQRCSQCGHVAPENRESQAVFRCVACAFMGNADVNAALNILAAGRAAIAREGRHDPVSPSSGQTVEPRTQLRDPASAELAGNPGQSHHVA